MIILFYLIQIFKLKHQSPINYSKLEFCFKLYDQNKFKGGCECCKCGGCDYKAAKHGKCKKILWWYEKYKQTYGVRVDHLEQVQYDKQTSDTVTN